MVTFQAPVLMSLLNSKKFVPQVLLWYFISSRRPHLRAVFSGKRIGTNHKPIVPQWVSDLSLLCHKGIPTPWWAIESGDDIKIVQGNLGHATATFTLTSTPTPRRRCASSPLTGWNVSSNRCPRPSSNKGKISKSPVTIAITGLLLARKEGFEPSHRFYPVYSLSRGAPSATWVLPRVMIRFFKVWRREWDSNPRALARRRFSRPVPSTTRTSLHSEGAVS